MTESLLETGRLADTSEPAKTVDPTQHPVAWVRSTFYGLAARTVVVRCPLCYRDHSHEWQYESGDQDPGERPAPCGRSEYVVRLRRAPRERMPNKPPPASFQPKGVGDREPHQERRHNRARSRRRRGYHHSGRPARAPNYAY